ncbi:MAG: POTRA domain-containing protein [Saprospiraceae bacterium]
MIFFAFGMVLMFGKTMGQTDFVIIDSVQIIGNKKTKRNVIFKEIDLHPGDTIGLDQLAKRLSINEKRLQSIGLFTLASINVKNWNTDLGICNIEINVQEYWFIYPYVIFELADRNFNVWRKEQNYSFERVNYGLALNHINLTGNKDKLKIKVQGGYTRKLELSYNFPYLSNRWGLSTNVLYSENREIAYRSLGSKPAFYRNEDDRKVFFQHRASLSLLHRTNTRMFQSLRLEFISARVDTFVSNTLNRQYFGHGREKSNYLYLDYLALFDNTIYPLYPLGGYRLEFNVRKEGLGVFGNVNNTWATMSYEKHSPLTKRWILSNKLKIKVNLQEAPLPYFLNASIGYKTDNIIGYQLYVLDGRNFILINNALRCKIVDKHIRTSKYFPDQFKIMNIKIFGRFNFDYGYADDPAFGDDNFLSNSHEYGYGPGIDVILFNNFTLSLEYGITRFREAGFFIESGLNF